MEVVFELVDEVIDDDLGIACLTKRFTFNVDTKTVNIATRIVSGGSVSERPDDFVECVTFAG